MCTHSNNELDDDKRMFCRNDLLVYEQQLTVSKRGSDLHFEYAVTPNLYITQANPEEPAMLPAAIAVKHSRSAADLF